MSTEVSKRRISIDSSKIDEPDADIPKIKTRSSVNQIIKRRKSLQMTPSTSLQAKVSRSQAQILDKRSPETKKLVAFDNEENTKIRNFDKESLLPSTEGTLTTSESKSSDHSSKEEEEVESFDDREVEDKFLVEDEERDGDEGKVVFSSSVQEKTDEQISRDNKIELDEAPVKETNSDEKVDSKMDHTKEEESKVVADEAVTSTSGPEIGKEEPSTMAIEKTKNGPLSEDDPNYLADIFGEDVLPLSFSKYEIKSKSSLYIKQEEELEEEEQEAEEEEPIDREYYYNLYQQLSYELLEETILHGFLQKKMAKYYKKKKMDYVLRESTKTSATSESKFNKSLEELYKLRETTKNEVTDAREEISFLLEVRDRELKEVVKNFASMQKRLKDVGAGLKYTKSGTEIGEELVDSFLKRQKYGTDQLISKRHLLIRLRNGVQEKEEKIRQVECLFSDDPKVTLNRYMELLLTNKMHQDKLEEKEAEMNYHRCKVKVAYQTLAHIREKIDFVQKEIIELENKIEDLNREFNLRRAYLGEVQKKRDVLRQNLQNLFGKSGLLLYPSLQRDFENVLRKHAARAVELENLKTECREQREELVRIQKVKERKKFLLESKLSQSLLPQIPPTNIAPAIRISKTAIIGDGPANTMNVIALSKFVTKSLPPDVVVPHKSQTALSVQPRPYKFNSK